MACAWGFCAASIEVSAVDRGEFDVTCVRSGIVAVTAAMALLLSDLGVPIGWFGLRRYSGIFNGNTAHTIAVQDHFRPSKQNLETENVPVAMKRTTHMNPTSACAPRVSINSPDIGMQMSVASEAMK